MPRGKGNPRTSLWDRVFGAGTAGSGGKRATVVRPAKTGLHQRGTPTSATPSPGRPRRTELQPEQSPYYEAE